MRSCILFAMLAFASMSFILPGAYAYTVNNSSGFAGYQDGLSSPSGVSKVTMSWKEPGVTCALGTKNAFGSIQMGFTSAPDSVIAGSSFSCANPSGTMTVRYFTFFAFSNWYNGASCGVINKTTTHSSQSLLMYCLPQ